MVMVVYFPLIIGGSNLARRGHLPAYPALWLGNILMAILAIRLMRRVLRR